MTAVKCSAEYRPDGEPLMAARPLMDWIGSLPASAILSPVTIDKGNQRDPWPVLVGLRATWEEER